MPFSFQVCILGDLGHSASLRAGGIIRSASVAQDLAVIRSPDTSIMQLTTTLTSCAVLQRPEARAEGALAQPATASA